MTRVQELTLDDLVWPDGTVRLADSGFPIQWAEADLIPLEEMRIALAKVPGSDDFAIGVWSKGTGTGPALHSLRYVDRIDQIHQTGRLMTLADGVLVQYGPSRKCGCGSRLRGFRAWGDRRVLAERKPTLPWVYEGQ